MSTDTDKRRMGPFQLEDKLGVGGMGIVYRATYLKTGQQVALKVLAPDLSLDPKVAKRFEREMDILRKLKHPHIIRYYGGSTTGAQRYYAMELLSGGALDTVLKKKGKFTWEEAIEYASQIAKALEHAHNASVIHRDLKPSNLLLTKDNKLKLSDFGIARDTQATQLTAAGKTVGTMAYMAPEQITGKQPVSRKTDLYALGCVLFEMLTGRPPFQSETQPELLFKHIEEAPPSVREFNMDVPMWLDRLINELLEKDPNDRPFDALAVQVKLEEIKQKVAERASIVAQTAAEGGAGATIKNGDKTIAGLLGGSKKKRKKKKKGVETPIYERAWFLAIPLVAIVALVAWKLGPQLMPVREAEVYARVAPLMADADPGVWLGAEDDVRILVEKFPEGEHAEQAKKWLEDIKVEIALRQFEKIELQKPNYSPESESEKLYVQALQYEKLGDRIGALETYDSMRTVLKFDTSDKGKAIQVLAQRNAQKLRAEGDTGGSRVDFVRKLLEEADQLYRKNPLEAREKWRSIVGAYGGKKEFEPLVLEAEQRLDNPEKALAELEEKKSDTAPDAPE